MAGLDLPEPQDGPGRLAMTGRMKRSTQDSGSSIIKFRFLPEKVAFFPRQFTL
jgi:hypothetical protein